MPFNVEDFTGQIASLGLASPNKFEVDVYFPTGTSEKSLNLMCENASIAGRTVQSMLDIQYGVRREIAYGAPQYTPLSLTFLCTEGMEQKTMLDKCNNSIVDATVATKPFNVAYYDDYKGRVKVKKLDKAGNQVLEVEYLDAWPKTVSQVDLSHATTNATLRVTCEFSYSYWKTKIGGSSNYTRTGLPPVIEQGIAS